MDYSATSLDDQPLFRQGAFLIGNHADELTPWIPVLSTLSSASGYLSIPCCAWSFDTRYERSAIALFTTATPEFVDSLNLGGDGSNSSSYSMYRIWLASLSLHLGWKVECETLRIPSTRNWAVVGARYISSIPNEGLRIFAGRARTTNDPDQMEKFKANAEDIVRNVRERGMFKTRRPEGKAGDH